MKLTKAEHDFLMTLMAQAYVFAENHSNPTERREMSQSLMTKLDENLIAYGYADQVGELEASVSRHPAGKKTNE
jgi:hypothetical protein